MEALMSLKDEVFTHNARFTSATAYRYTFIKLNAFVLFI